MGTALDQTVDQIIAQIDEALKRAAVARKMPRDTTLSDYERAFAHAVIAAYWWFALRGAWTNLFGLGAAYFLVGASTAALIAANLNYLAKITPAEDRTLMVSVHGAVIACFGGVSAAILGFLLKRGNDSVAMSLAGFQWFYVSVFAGAVFLLWRIARLPEQTTGKFDVLTVGSAILRPFRAMPYVRGLIGSKGKDAR